MPSLRKSVRDAVKRYDRLLDIVWKAEPQRWMLVREIPFSDKHHDLLLIEDSLGGYKEPREDLLEYLFKNDLKRFGSDPKVAVRRFLAWKDEHNAALKEAEQRAGADERFARFQEHVGYSARSDKAKIGRRARYFQNRKEWLDANGDLLTQSGRNALARGGVLLPGEHMPDM